MSSSCWSLRVGVCTALVLLVPTLAAADPPPPIHVADDVSLRDALLRSGAGDTIVFDADITLTLGVLLPQITTGVTIDGNGHALSGDGQFRGFEIGAIGIPTSVTLQNLTIRNAAAFLGDGTDGLGGAIRVFSGSTATVSNVSLVSNLAGADQFGGTALGGAVFLDSGSNFLVSGPLTINGNQVSAGAGPAAGSGMFLDGKGSLAFLPSAGATVIVNDVIADQGGTGAGFTPGSWDLFKSGAGTLVLGAANLYSGSTFVSDGTLSVSSDANLGVGGALFMNGGTLAITGDATFARQALIANGSAFSVTPGRTATWAGSIDDLDGPGALHVTGGGTLVLGNAANSYSGGTLVNGGSTVSINVDAALGAAGAPVALGDAGSSGTLAITAPGAFSSARPFVLGGGGGAISTPGGTNADLLGTISGPGTLTKTGAGTLTLGGSNSFTGGVAVNAGALTISSDANLGAGGALSLANATSVNITSTGQFTRSLFASGTATLNIASGTTTTWNGQVADGIGGGTLRVAGGGTLALANSGNSYSGGTVVTGGSTLLVGTDSALGASSGTLTLGDGGSGGTLAISARSFVSARSVVLGGSGSAIDTIGQTNAVFSGPIGGAGTLVKNGAGTLTLGGANTFSGGIVVNSGALIGNTASLHGNITNGATVVFDQNTAGTYAGTMTGAGSLIKSGSGTLALTGANTYSGGTLISSGTLVGTTASLQGTIVNNGALVFDQSIDGAFTGTILGTGSVTKAGNGALGIGGVNTLNGLFTVGQGTLALNGAVDGNVSVGAQGTLRGSGVIGGSLNLTGTLFVPTPGSSSASFNFLRVSSIHPDATASQVPSLVINGDLNATPGSVLAFTVAPNAAAPIVVNGRASLTGTHVNVTVDDPNPARNATYLALTANGVTVNGTDASSAAPNIVPVLTHNDRSMFVTLLNYNVPLGGSATTPNAIAAGQAIDQVKSGATGDLGSVIREVTALDDAHLNAALENLAGEIHASSVRLAIADSVSITDLVRNTIDERDHDDDDDTGGVGRSGRPRWWFQLTGEHVRIGSSVFRSAVADVGGGAGGVDFKPADRWTVGGGGSFSRGGLSLAGLGGSSDLSAPRAFGYTGFSFGPFSIHGGGSAASTSYSTTRQIVFAATVPTDTGTIPLSDGINRTATSDQRAVTRDAWSEWQDTFKFKTWVFDWKLGWRAARYGRGSFNEAGANAISLAAASQAFSTKESDINIHVFRKKGTWRPRVLLTYRRQLGDQTNTADVQFNGRPDSQFVVNGLPLAQDEFHGIAGLTMRTSSGLEYTFEYETRRAPDETHQGVHFRVRFR